MELCCMQRMSVQTRSMFFRHGGFTLVELMVVIAITAVIATIGIPSYRNMSVSSRVSDMSSSLHGAFMLARSEALKRNGRVVVCKIANPAPARPACDVSQSTAANMGWANGWMIFADRNGDSVLDAGEDLIRVQNNLAKGITDGAIIPNVNQQSLAFGAMGQSFMAINFVVSGATAGQNTAQSKAVCVAVGGRVRVGAAPDCP